MKKRTFLTYLLIIIVALLIWFFKFSNYMEIDSCLDKGGKWDYELNQCLEANIYRQNQAIFKIKNQSKHLVNNLCLIAHENCDYTINVSPNEEANYILNMENIPKVDGDYKIKFSLNDTLKFETFGYYTNGYPMEDYIIIEIFNDSIVYDFKYK